MTKTGRNDPCPCGSGMKHKKCCLAREDAFSARRRDEDNAVRAALDWLSSHYPEQVRDALDEYFGILDEDGRTALNELSAQFHEMLNVNSAEWLLTEARLELDGGSKPACDLFLGPGGPMMTAQGRSWLEEIGKRSLSLYEVREVRPGEEIRVADLLNPEEPEVWVRERSGSRTLVRLDILGARLARQDGDWVLTGAVYPFVRDEALACRDEIERELEGEPRDTDLAREVVGTVIINTWLSSITARRPIPTLVDSSTQKQILLTTDHYRVNDWEALASIMAEQLDVEGDRTNGWVRFSEHGEMRRSRAALNVKEPESLEVFCRTLELADESRTWLEQVAGGVLKFRIREVVDPRSPKALESASPSPQAAIPPEMAAELIRNYMGSFYENWSDEPIPALGNKTPREAIRTGEGRRAVIELLKSYEHHEERRVRDQGGKPFDFGFLWDQLGLKRED